MNKVTLSWLAGILEGEGSFLKGPPSKPNHPVISLQMCDEDIVAKVAKLMDVSYCRVRIARAIKNGWKPTYHTVLRGKRAVELMKKLRPLMGIRRKSQIDKAVACKLINYPRLLQPEFAIREPIIVNLRKSIMFLESQ